MENDFNEIVKVLSRVPLFAGLSELDLRTMAGLFDSVGYHDGEVIFDDGDASEAMFVIGEGKIRLIYNPSTDEQSITNLVQGDVFGEESLLFDDPRYYQAVASGKTILYKLTIDAYLRVFGNLPEIEDLLEVSIRSRMLATQVHLPWLQRDEYVHVMTRRHPVILWSKLLKPLVFGFVGILLSALLQWQWLPERPFGWIGIIFTVLVSLIWLVWAIVDWRNDYFIVTNKRVVWIEKIALVYESRQEAPLRTIMSVGMSRSRLGSLLGYADVVVMTYVGTIRLRDLAQAEAIASLIEAYWHNADSINQHEEARFMEQKLHEKLDLPWLPYEETRVNTPQQEDQFPEIDGKEPGFFAWVLSDFIRLRFETDGAITYRKHWFVLIERIWLPILLFIFALTALAARLGGMFTFLSMTSGIVGSLVLMFIVFVWIVYQYADWRNDIFKVTFDQIIDIDRKPLGKVRRRSAPLENVLSIEYERLGFWGFLFNFGTVYISVGNTKLSFDHVYNPSEVQQDVFYRMGERLEKMRQFTIDSERDRVSEWIASYHRKTEQLRKMNESDTQNDDQHN